ncbi:DUF3087 domain-containing protein [Pseudomonas sp. gcc21]|uniref:DUF3087 domain-containing protein n=1 Tax=Pseudomonas sp. gcc21 TaxID=2726989 RepID=UPI0014523C00|nr:DUF3087 domain-containing protein [Pseudomonas sp. gcc21]QJD59330.1 DUF3087 domain-containing protein [Pseudomonas sp. gcc21]
MFELQPIDPEAYRRETRRSTLTVAVLFAVIAMATATVSVALFGEPGGNNFMWNLAGVLVGLFISSVVVRGLLWDKPFMASARYGWQLKRSLMRVTNVMHQVEAGVAADNPEAMKLLRFYHQGLTQMHELDGNTSALAELRSEKEAHRQRLEALGIVDDQPRLDPRWLDAIQGYGKKSK